MIKQYATSTVIGLFIGDAVGQVAELSSDEHAQLSIPKATHPMIASAFNDVSSQENIMDSSNLILAILLGLNDTFIADQRRKDFSIPMQAIAYLSHLAIGDIPLDDYMKAIWNDCGGHDDKFDMTFRKIGHVLGWGSTKHAMRHIGDSHDLASVITLSLYCILRQPDHLEKALRIAMQAPHNRHLVSIITSTIFVNRTGISAIPPNWQVAVDNQIDVDHYRNLLINLLIHGDNY